MARDEIYDALVKKVTDTYQPANKEEVERKARAFLEAHEAKDKADREHGERLRAERRKNRGK